MLKVLFSDSQFVRSHMKAPKGRGSWAFSLEERPADVFFSPSMTLSEAKKWATAQVRAMDFIPTEVSHVYVDLLP